MGNNDLQQRLLPLKSKQQHLEQQGRCLYSEAVLGALSECCQIMAFSMGRQSLKDNQHNVEHLLQLQEQLKKLALCQPEQQNLPPASQQDPQAMQGAALQPERDAQRIAPRHEPLAYFKHLVAQPVVQDAATMTAKDLAGSIKEAVLRSSLELQRTAMQQLPTDAQALQRAWDRSHVCLMSALIHGRLELIAHVNSYNLQDMTDAPDTLPAMCARQAERIPAVLSLTAQQVQDITAGSALFSRLMQDIAEEKQQALAQCDSSSSAGSTTSSSSSGGGDGGSSSELSDASLDILHQDKETGQTQMRRLQVLLHKEYTVRAATAAWFAGCLSWEQFTKANIAAWPSVLLVTQLAVAIPNFKKEV